MAVGAALAAGRVFLAYQPTPTVAPGVFRLPTPWLRPYGARLAVGVLALVPLAWAAAELPEVYDPPPLIVYRIVSSGTVLEVLPAITGEENDFLTSLPRADQEDYVRVLKARRVAERRLERASRREYHRGLLTAAAAASVVPPAVFLVTLVATAGPLLAAFHTVFERGGSE